MKKQFTLLVILFLTFAYLPAMAGDKRPSGLKQNMAVLADHYFKLDDLSKNSKRHREEITKRIGAMQETMQVISALNKDKKLNRSLAILSEKIASLKKENTSKKPRLQKNLDDIYSTCFNCHAAHWNVDY